MDITTGNSRDIVTKKIKKKKNECRFISNISSNENWNIICITRKMAKQENTQEGISSK